ncbi:MAG: hypothetical protein COB02_11495 [Candidatus Cloacimonadota bacterium]|nr:MAG: hypothetical protein COB02_11495 [Candidatus Cloacimonadota bacterium]
MCKITFNENRDKLHDILENFSKNLGLQKFHFNFVECLIETRCDLEKINFELFLKSNINKFLWVKQVYIYMVYHYKEPELLKRDLELLCFLFSLSQKDRTKISLEVKFAPIHSKYSSEQDLKIALSKDFLYTENMKKDRLDITCALLLFGNKSILDSLSSSQKDSLYISGKTITQKLFSNDLLKEGEWQDLFGKVEVCGVEEETNVEDLEIEVDNLVEEALIEEEIVLKKEIIVEEIKNPYADFEDFEIYLPLDKEKSVTISGGMFLAFLLIGFLMGSIIIGLLGGLVMAFIIYPLYLQNISISFIGEKLNIKIDNETISMYYEDVLRIEKRMNKKLTFIFRDIELRPIEVNDSNESFKKLKNRIKESILNDCLVEVNG